MDKSAKVVFDQQLRLMTAANKDLFFTILLVTRYYEQYLFCKCFTSGDIFEVKQSLDIVGSCVLLCFYITAVSLQE